MVDIDVDEERKVLDVDFRQMSTKSNHGRKAEPDGGLKTKPDVDSETKTGRIPRKLSKMNGNQAPRDTMGKMLVPKETGET